MVYTANTVMDALTEQALLDGIQSLAVAIVHPWVHAVSLFEIRQKAGEPTRQFVSRVRMVAKNCNMKQQCGSQTCTQMNSLEEAIAFYATLAGLEDMELRNQVITMANLDKIVDLAKLEAHCATYEIA